MVDFLKLYLIFLIVFNNIVWRGKWLVIWSHMISLNVTLEPCLVYFIHLLDFIKSVKSSNFSRFTSSCSLVDLVRSIVVVFSCSVMSDSAAPWTFGAARLLCPWDFLGKNTGVGCHFLLQGIFQIQGSNPHLLH